MPRGKFETFKKPLSLATAKIGTGKKVHLSNIIGQRVYEPFGGGDRQVSLVVGETLCGSGTSSFAHNYHNQVVRYLDGDISKADCKRCLRIKNARSKPNE